MPKPTGLASKSTSFIVISQQSSLSRNIYPKFSFVYIIQGGFELFVQFNHEAFNIYIIVTQELN